MFRRALAPAAVLLLVTACSGRENNLYTYYDDPTSEPVTAAAPITTTAVPTTTTPPPTTTTSAPDLTTALLTADDLAAEGVTAVREAPAGSCPVDAAWEYPSGSTLVQAVRPADDWAATLGACVDGDATEGPDLGDLGDDTRSWCFTDADRRGCGAVVAKGGLVTVIVVEAGSTQRAGEAVARIAPLAAGALDRV